MVSDVLEPLGEVVQEVVEVTVLLRHRFGAIRIGIFEKPEDVAVLVRSMGSKQIEQSTPPVVQRCYLLGISPVGVAGSCGDVEQAEAEGLVNVCEEVVSCWCADHGHDRKPRRPLVISQIPGGWTRRCRLACSGVWTFKSGAYTTQPSPNGPRGNKGMFPPEG